MKNPLLVLFIQTEYFCLKTQTLKNKLYEKLVAIWVVHLLTSFGNILYKRYTKYWEKEQTDTIKPYPIGVLFYLTKKKHLT